MKMALVSLNLNMYRKGFRSFHGVNTGAVGQRASKLLAVKVVGLKKKSTGLVITAKVCASTSGQARARTELNHSQSLADGNFPSLRHTDHI